MKLPASDQKLRGGYYTPPPIAAFLAEWAVQTPTTSVIEPSCGDGEFLAACARVLEARGSPIEAIGRLLSGVEVNPDEAQKAMSRLAGIGLSPDSLPVHTGDFFAFCQLQLMLGKRYSALVGNPPFIRYQNFSEPYRTTAFHLMAHAGLKPNRLTNAWVPFIVAGTLLLGDHGRLAMVVPAELLQVTYAAQLREFLVRQYSSITLLTFRQLVFSGIQQEVVLLLAERHGGMRTGVRTVELNGIDDLSSLQHYEFASRDAKTMHHGSEKWTMYFLDQSEIDLLRRLRECKGVVNAGQVIDVDVGIVTGLNDFFLLTDKQVEDWDLRSYASRVVGRSGQLKGVVFSEVDWQTLVGDDSRAYLFTPPDVPHSQLPPELRSYVTHGERHGMNRGYKCRIRKNWYVVPSKWEPDAFMLRQIHAYPKLVLNESGATCTDTIHRVRMRNGLPAQQAVSAFLNSMTFAFAEVMGRSYGGGVLELEPSEAEELPLPIVNCEHLNLHDLDKLLNTQGIDAVLDVTDQVQLMEGLGLSTEEVRMLRNVWKKLRDRRTQRK